MKKKKEKDYLALALAILWFVTAILLSFTLPILPALFGLLSGIRLMQFLEFINE